MNSAGSTSTTPSVRSICPVSRIDAFGVSDAHRGWDDLDVLPDLLEDLQADVHPPRRRWA